MVGAPFIAFLFVRVEEPRILEYAVESSSREIQSFDRLMASARSCIAHAKFGYDAEALSVPLKAVLDIAFDRILNQMLQNVFSNMPKRG